MRQGYSPGASQIDNILLFWQRLITDVCHWGKLGTLASIPPDDAPIQLQSIAFGTNQKGIWRSRAY